MIITYEELTTPLIENTTFQIALKDGIPSSYRITPNEGYLLHDKGRDIKDSLGELIQLGYTTGTTTCSYSYDFEENSREFYTILKEEITE